MLPRQSKSDLDLLQGAWSVACLEVDGEKLPPDIMAAARWVEIVPGHARRFAAPKFGAPKRRRSRTGDAAPSCRRFPKAVKTATTPVAAGFGIAYGAGGRLVAGVHRRTQLAIYACDGATLTLSTAPPGEPRPSDFAERGANTVTVFRKKP